MLTATCHCGKVRLETPRWPRKLTLCNCSVCRRYGAIWGYFRRKAVLVSDEQGVLVPYAWGSANIEFHHCGACGCVMHHSRVRRRDDGTDTLAINLRNADEPNLVSGLPVRMLDGADTWKVREERPCREFLGW